MSNKICNIFDYKFLENVEEIKDYDSELKYTCCNLIIRNPYNGEYWSSSVNDLTNLLEIEYVFLIDIYEWLLRNFENLDSKVKDISMYNFIYADSGTYLPDIIINKENKNNVKFELIPYETERSLKYIKKDLFIISVKDYEKELEKMNKDIDDRLKIKGDVK